MSSLGGTQWTQAHQLLRRPERSLHFLAGWLKYIDEEVLSMAHVSSELAG